MRPHFDAAELTVCGLNLQAVFDLADLPTQLAASLRVSARDGDRYRQLILLGHAGRTLWNAVQAEAAQGADPIDDFTVRRFEAWAVTHLAGRAHELLYPGPAAIGLQSLGQLAGWHHASPFMVGINDRWGTWFAYRAAVLSDTDFAPTPRLPTASPCADCAQPPCIASCPAGAVTDTFNLAACIAYRKHADSRCKYTCVARETCPVGGEHRYTAAQLHHSYSRSLRWIGGS